jgi:hypothetical protein
MNDQKLSALRRRMLVRHHPSAFLLATQLFSLMLYAAFDGIHSGRAMLGAVSVLVLPLAVWVVSRSPAINWIAWALATPAFVLWLLAALLVDVTLVAWSALLDAALYFYTAGSLIAYMMQDERVTSDELFAAGATFTLIAWGFAYVYLVWQTWYPDSFIGETRPGEPRTFIELLFLSFTNLSAVGVGDVLPISSAARVLVMLEQFAGVAYIAVVVSRLIGLTILRSERKGTP